MEPRHIFYIFLEKVLSKLHFLLFWNVFQLGNSLNQFRKTNNRKNCQIVCFFINSQKHVITKNPDIEHCIKSARIRSISGLYFPAFWLNKENYFRRSGRDSEKDNELYRSCQTEIFKS